MSVFTTVTPEDLSVWLKQFAVGELVALEGIASGIENTNYFVSTTQSEYVLTLFEKLQPDELPFYLELMDHLARHGLPCPGPVLSLDNRLFGELNGKPATLVSRLKGRSVMEPTVEHCAALGAVLAETHLVGQNYRGKMENPRGPNWWFSTAAQMVSHLDDAHSAVLHKELGHQSKLRFEHLPKGVIHADLFRDNALFDGDRVGGVIDFYFACTDVLLYDVAITVNDWCVTEDGDIDTKRCRALLSAYNRIRPFTAIEALAWITMLRAGALRFWLSRLYDMHCPRPGEMTQVKDPEHFYRVLTKHSARLPGDLWM